MTITYQNKWARTHRFIRAEKLINVESFQRTGETQSFNYTQRGLDLIKKGFRINFPAYYGSAYRCECIHASEL